MGRVKNESRPQRLALSPVAVQKVGGDVVILRGSHTVTDQSNGGVGWLFLLVLSTHASVSCCTSSLARKISRAAVSIPVFQMSRLSSRVTRLESNESLVGQPITCSPVLFPIPHTLPLDIGPEISSQAKKGAAPNPSFFWQLENLRLYILCVVLSNTQ